MQSDLRQITSQILHMVSLEKKNWYQNKIQPPRAVPFTRHSTANLGLWHCRTWQAEGSRATTERKKRLIPPMLSPIWYATILSLPPPSVCACTGRSACRIYIGIYRYIFSRSSLFRRFFISVTRARNECAAPCALGPDYVCIRASDAVFGEPSSALLCVVERGRMFSIDYVRRTFGDFKMCDNRHVDCLSGVLENCVNR